MKFNIIYTSLKCQYLFDSSHPVILINLLWVSRPWVCISQTTTYAWTRWPMCCSIPRSLLSPPDLWNTCASGSYQQVNGSHLILGTINTHVLVDLADKSRSIFYPVILSSGICSPYKWRATSEVLACQFIKNFLFNTVIKIPQNRNHSRHQQKSWPSCSPESHV